MLHCIVNCIVCMFLLWLPYGVINYNNNRLHREHKIVVAAVYMPIDIKPPHSDLERLVQYCNSQKISLILGCDANAHHSLWGSKNCNYRGQALCEYLATTDIEVVNQGSEPTFCVGNKKMVIDITLASRELLPDINEWQAMPGDSLSDHREIQFKLVHHAAPVKRINWQTYNDELCARVGLWISRVETPADIERELTNINSAIIKSFEVAFPEHKVGGRSTVPWWNRELKQLRRKANKAFHTAF